MPHLTARTVAFSAAQVSQAALGIGILNNIRTLAYSLPYDEGKRGWDWSMWLLYVVGTQRFWVYVLGALLLTLQIQAFRSTAKRRDAMSISCMFVTVVLLASLFVNGLFVAMRQDQVTLFVGTP